jgi:diguanylate cyclase (GGDEF)-like protein
MVMPEFAHDEPPSPYALRSKNMVRRSLPFLGLAIVAELSLALPPGPASTTDTLLSALLLGATVALFMLPWSFLPAWLRVMIPLCYVGSALALVLAAGGSSAGVGLVVLLPILWSALSLELWQSMVVVVGVAVVEFVTTYVPADLSDSIGLRREIAWLAIGGLLAFTVHEIRNRIARIGSQREAINAEMLMTISELNERNRSSSILSKLVEMLNFCDAVEEAYEVFNFSAKELFETPGFIGVLNDDNDLVDVQFTWGGFTNHDLHFSVNQCQALQQRRPYESDLENPACAHRIHSPFVHALCQPLMIQNEILGVITIALSEVDELSPVADRYRQYALLLGDQISIWTANFKLRESLRHMSIRDPLTNLFNRRFMIETLDREMSITTRSHEPTSIIQMDVDHFKEFNDTYGHEVGDSVLRAVALVMLDLFRDSDVPCRSGGEEFTLILPRCSWEIANLRAMELQLRLAETVITVPSDLAAPKPPTLSIGIATSPDNGLTGQDLLQGADKALYEAKAAGRNRIVRAHSVEQASA